MALFIWKFLVFRTFILLILFQFHTIVSACLIAIIRSLIVHRLLQWIAGLVGYGSCLGSCSRIVLVLLSFTVYDGTCSRILTIIRVYQHVEGIVVEGELVAVFLRHRAKNWQSTIVLVSLVVVTTILTIFRTVVCRNNQVVNLLGNLLLDIRSVLKPIIICRLIAFLHTSADVDKLRLAKLDSACTDICRFHITSHWSSLCSRYRTANVQVNVNVTFILSIFLGNNICNFKVCQFIRILDVATNFSLKIFIDILRDDVAHLVIALTEDTTRSTGQVVSRTIFITCTSCLVLLMLCTFILRIPRIPVRWVVDPIGQHITGIVTKVIGWAEHEVEGDILIGSRVMNILHSGLALFQYLWLSNVLVIFVCALCAAITWQHYVTISNSNVVFTYRTISDSNVGLVYKQSLLRLGQ